MNIPAHVLAQANPLARATMEQMTIRPTRATASVRMSAPGQMLRVDIVENARRRLSDPTEGMPTMAARANLRVDIVAKANERAAQNSGPQLGGR